MTPDLNFDCGLNSTLDQSRVHIYQIEIRSPHTKESIAKFLCVIPYSVYVPYSNFKNDKFIFEFKMLIQRDFKNFNDLKSMFKSINLNNFNYLLFIPDSRLILDDSKFDQLHDSSQFASIFTRKLKLEALQNISLFWAIPIFLSGFAKVGPVCNANDTIDKINDLIKSHFSDSYNAIKFIEPNKCFPDDHLINETDFPCSAVIAMLSSCLQICDIDFPQSITVFNENDHFLLQEKSTPMKNLRYKSPFVKCIIAGHTFEAMIDTGSEVTLISQEFFNHLKDVTQYDFPIFPATGLYLRGVTGVKSKNVQSQILIDFNFGGQIFQKSVLVVPSINVSFILGIDFLVQFNGSIDCANKCINLSNGDIKVPWVKYEPVQVGSVSQHQKPSVYLFTDSHGRELEDLVKDKMSKSDLDFDFHVQVKPGATFNEVISDISVIKDNLKPDDVVIVIPGINDLDYRKPVDLVKCYFDVTSLQELDCNVMLFEVLQRHDDDKFRKVTHAVNNYLKKCLVGHKKQIIPTINAFRKPDFTVHGLHLNKIGKCKLAQIISDKLQESISVTENFPPIEDNLVQVNRAYVTTEECDPTKFSFENNHLPSKDNVVNSSCTKNKNIPEPNLGLCGVKTTQMPERSDKLLTDQQIWEKLNTFEINKTQKRKLFNVLAKYRKVFSDKPGLCNKFTAKFRVKNDEVFVKRSYPVPFSYRNMVRDEIQRLLSLNIIERSSSPYSNPIVPVTKSDGSCRLCLDARTLNTKLVADSETPENIDTLLYRFPSPKFISTLDCTASFLQIPLDEDSRDMTSFVFEGRNYRFTRVPFGTKVSMQLFMKATGNIFGPEVEDFLSQFVDDFRIVSESFENHLEHIEIILSKLLDAGITLNFAKCKFLQKQVEYLGYILSDKGISMNPERVKAIEKFPEPRNIKELQSFLGLVNFYRKFKMNHSDLTAPLFLLLKKDVRWKWTDEERKAFSEIKKNFIDNVMLSYPCLSKPYYLNSDASFNAISCELFQYDDEDNRRPIAFYSRTLTQSEKNYTVTELELLAIVAGCQKFRQYILGFQTYVYSDHHALQFLNKCILSSGRLTRWALFLQEYNLEIKYIKGSENTAADCLSRFPPQLHNLPENNLEINVNAFKYSFSPDFLKKN